MFCVCVCVCVCVLSEILTLPYPPLQFSPDEQAKFLMFITSNSRTPLKGFKALTPVPCIQQVYSNTSQGGEENGTSERLPTAATCMNLLKLPKYKDKETLKAKLTYAVMSGAGFELS